MTTIKDASMEALEFQTSSSTNPSGSFTGKFKGHAKTTRGIFHSHTDRHRKQVTDIYNVKSRIITQERNKKR